jgi:DNA replication and repair protein RecF
MTGLLRLTLTDFRSYAVLRFEPGAPLAVLVGPNGAGKTNLLEAVSLLVPGRGLRAAKPAELLRDGAATWAVAGQFGHVSVGTGIDETGKRVFLLDGVRARSQAEIAARLSAVWLTPQMDRIFTEGAGARRRFLDRLVVALEPGHAREVAAFDASSANRNRVLAMGRPDRDWLAALEDAMARHAVAAAAARRALISRLNAMLDAGAADPFPRVRLGLDCEIATALGERPAVEVEVALKDRLAGARAQDAARGAPAIGPSRADLMLEDARTGRPAALSSTGQQKAMLVGIVLGHAGLIAAATGDAPFLLLDEPLIHLDEAHRAALFSALHAGRLHAILTGTDLDPFRPLGDGASYFTVAANGATSVERIV